MAVFPDRIVLKNSTDSEAAIVTAIGSGGTDPITQGEIVVGLTANAAKFYTLDGSGNVISLGGTVSEVIDDLTPQLGGDLDVNGFYIGSASGGDVVVAPDTTGGFIVRGNNTDGSITLNCTANTHAVTIQSPPHSDAATYSLILPSSAGTAGQVLTSQGGAQLTWEDAGSGGFADPMTTDGDIIIRSGGTTTRLGIGSESQVLTVSSGLPVWAAATGGGATAIDDLTDVDTSTTPPTTDQVLAWNGTSWVPADQTGGSGGGSIAGTILQKEETQTASAGAATFTELGESGLLVSVSTTADAWVVLYPTAADRTADSSRAYGVDPAPGSGVLAEFYVTTSGAILASPGTTYFNNDTVSTSALYAAVRDQAGSSVAADITIKAYVHQGFGGTGTARVTDSGTASSGLLTLTGMGQTGQFCTVTSSLDAWVVFYGSEADRTADNARAFATDPTPGSGVQAEFYIAAGATILATPGSTYFNNDTSPTEAMYLAVRDTGGSSVNSLITVTVYAETSYTGISGGTFGSG